MKKEIEIEGMSCGHCQSRVEKALNAIDGVSAKVILNKNKALVELSRDVPDETLINAIVEAGYDVVSIK
jgi:copper ion binding protein